jgi:hypothetical protein
MQAYQVLKVRLLCAVAGLLLGGSVYAESALHAESAQAVREPVSSSAMAKVVGRVLTLMTGSVAPHKLWAGTEYGGLWQSADAGISWIPVSDAMSGLSVHSLAVDPVNPNVMYAGAAGVGGKDETPRQAGLFKSIDAGASWSLLPLTNPAAVGESWSRINHIAISSAGVILAATADHRRNGFIFRSVDGGHHWGLFPVYMGSTVGPHNMIYKVKFDPDNPATAIFMDDYANVTHSTDAGVTWQVAGKSTTCK